MNVSSAKQEVKLEEAATKELELLSLRRENGKLRQEIEMLLRSETEKLKDLRNQVSELQRENDDLSATLSHSNQSVPPEEYWIHGSYCHAGLCDLWCLCQRRFNDACRFLREAGIPPPSPDAESDIHALGRWIQSLTEDGARRAGTALIPLHQEMYDSLPPNFDPVDDCVYPDTWFLNGEK